MALNKKILPLMIVGLLAFVLTSGAQKRSLDPLPKTRADMVGVMTQLQDHLANLEKSHHSHGEAAGKLATLYSKLNDKAKEVGALADAAKGRPADSSASARMFAATKQMQDMQVNFNLQFLQLQSAMQNENRQFTMISNIMKTKHDTAKNAISNIR